MKLLDLLSKGIVIGDGAVGTLLHSHGLQSSFEELNLSDPDRIISIHKQYVAAGADIIQTNTYGANEAKLRMYGLENQVVKINKEAVKLAKSAVTDRNAILGTIGGMKHIGAVTTTDMEREFMLLEQAGALLEGEVDGLLLETFYDEFELLHAVKVLRKQTTIPIIAQLALHEAGTTQNGNDVNKMLAQLLDHGANVVGLNCQLGPLHMTEAFKMISIPKKGYLSAYPNAGLPNYVEGRYVYEGSPAYFEEMTPKFIEQGIRLLGGCCGTTPAHIQGMKRALENVIPVTEKQVVQRPQVIHTQTKRAGNHVTLAEKAKKQTTVIVELDPPKTLDTQRFFEGARALKRAGADAVTLADNSLASPRISNMAMGALLTKHNIPVLTHLTCRDHNVIGLQSHLLGLSALGMEEVLALTGDPARVGDFPGATSVYDLSSIELTKMIKEMNDGRSILGKSIGPATRFSVGGAFNPNVRHLKAAVKRMERKIAAGAEYFLTQPIYDAALIEEVYEATKHLEQPIFIGIMPLVSKRNADFLHFEVPGITLPEEIRTRMEGHETSQAAIEEGIRISQELIDAAMEFFNGIYLITPFLKYEITEQLTGYVREKQKAKEGINL
ncbi:bifunctional homocysteine S-methyltransferase/methylenetetrahydrofolate reductase [Bacillus sp. DX1.1]|uniref:bifunctional homocysteine S-methyltransferase/methylenetetrahydrofolate reductase n=1 Tax=unclassified Bacillus (in: firmicutes) TaxID=185979 RepID=UPI00256FFBB7|nr:MULTISPECIES: bifunctional homocysteine S-methyltransferase/methylenetetrahydrofolate reductase [unclassified Bacillus (in: firmicutes)]MDM5156454.1 bifunctional homocysteine S-methyltransferase/methylenetetrahydrofolate reductase [Bacillus sp. DX1.1]WJE80721.1 bifunctional homocysteine S-methyltransferase/methylenetetrahydrofolate reductase [Bacillus sp. DX3.1]